MVPRERVLEAVKHHQTDRAPADYQAHQEVTDRLMARLGVSNHEELLQALSIDMRRIWMPYGLPQTGPDEEGYFTDMWGLRTRPAADGQPAESVPPFGEDTTVEDVLAHPWPSAEAIQMPDVRSECQQYADTYATYGAPWSPFFHEVGWLIGQENLFIWMHTKPDVIDAIIDAFVTFEVNACLRYFEACDGLLDIAYFGNDFGTQRCMFISPAQWERFFRKPLKRFFDIAHDFGLKVMKHSCGSIRAIIPALIEDGVDILDPVQVRAEGMDLPGLVRDFGDRLTFHGGVDTQHVLPFGTPQEVQAQARSYIELTRERGGYILAGSQDLIADIPDDNILAMYDVSLR